MTVGMFSMVDLISTVNLINNIDLISTLDLYNLYVISLSLSLYRSPSSLKRDASHGQPRSRIPELAQETWPKLRKLGQAKA